MRPGSANTFFGENPPLVALGLPKSEQAKRTGSATTGNHTGAEEKFNAQNPYPSEVSNVKESSQAADPEAS
jgi:hypothetical protein